MVHDVEVTVRIRDLRHGGAACAQTVRWPLSTLAAFLFDGRECDQVRAILARGSAAAHEMQLTWESVALTAAELSEIERHFPAGAPSLPMQPERVAAAELHVPGLHPVLRVPLRMDDHPLVRRAAARAAHLRFDYGPWADIYVATLAPEEAAELLADPARRSTDAGSAELAARVVGEDDASLRFVVPRAGCEAPWAHAP